MSRARWLAPLALALVVAGCSAGPSGAGTTSPPTAAPSDDPSGGPQVVGGDAERAGGGVSGLIADVSGELMQVQGTDMQTAVTWTADTEITAEVAGLLADVVPGVCVTATVEDSSDAATAVVISDPVDGACTGGFGAGPGGASVTGPGGMPTDLPTDWPTDLPQGAATAMPGGGPDGGATWGRALGVRTVGLVTAVDGSTITLETADPGGEAGTSTVAVDADTTYTKAVASDASALVVGQCVAARGDADTSGRVTATSLTVSAPVDGTCVPTVRGGFGGGRPGTDGAPDLEEAGGDA